MFKYRTLIPQIIFTIYIKKFVTGYNLQPQLSNTIIGKSIGMVGHINSDRFDPKARNLFSELIPNNLLPKINQPNYIIPGCAWNYWGHYNCLHPETRTKNPKLSLRGKPYPTIPFHRHKPHLLGGKKDSHPRPIPGPKLGKSQRYKKPTYDWWSTTPLTLTTVAGKKSIKLAWIKMIHFLPDLFLHDRRHRHRDSYRGDRFRGDDYTPDYRSGFISGQKHHEYRTDYNSMTKSTIGPWLRHGSWHHHGHRLKKGSTQPSIGKRERFRRKFPQYKGHIDAYMISEPTMESVNNIHVKPISKDNKQKLDKVGFNIELGTTHQSDEKDLIGKANEENKLNRVNEPKTFRHLILSG
ncbi:unnamed protein product [Gordionus sp. m RMFG-2023]